MTRRRPVSDDERALWADVTRLIAPLRPRKCAAVVVLSTPPTEPPRPVARAKRTAAVAVPHTIEPAVKTAPPLAPLGRRLKQRVARGREAIDARIDLHGFTQAQAHAALQRFLFRAQADDARIVLIVTGKGSRAGASEGGVLKRQVPMWLGLPEFRRLIVGFEDAHNGHGGEGALYVRLRRSR